MPARGPRNAHRVAARLLAVATLVPLLACRDDSADDVTLVEGAVEQIDVIDNTFRPDEIEVAAGTEVEWTNEGRSDHDVLPVEGDEWGAPAEAFPPDAAYRRRFTEPGTFAYYCSLHGTTTKGMVGTIVVTG